MIGQEKKGGHRKGERPQVMIQTLMQIGQNKINQAPFIVNTFFGLHHLPRRNNPIVEFEKAVEKMVHGP